MCLFRFDCAQNLRIFQKVKREIELKMKAVNHWKKLREYFEKELKIKINKRTKYEK